MSFYEKRPVNGNHANVISITLLFVLLSGGGFYGLLSALETGDGRWVALLLTCAAGIVVAAWRVVQHDARAFVEREGLPEKPQAQPEVKRVIQPHVERATSGNQIAAGKYILTWEQWNALGLTLEKCSWKWVRDQVRKARPHVFEADEINLRWQQIIREFQRIGYVDEKQMTTPTGQDFFYMFIDPPASYEYPPSPAAANGKISAI